MYSHLGDVKHIHFAIPLSSSTGAADKVRYLPKGHIDGAKIDSRLILIHLS